MRGNWTVPKPYRDARQEIPIVGGLTFPLRGGLTFSQD